MCTLKMPEGEKKITRNTCAKIHISDYKEAMEKCKYVFYYETASRWSPRRPFS